MKIVTYPHPALVMKSVAVTAFNEELETLAANMLECMRASGGIGLAANQVGITKRVFVMSVDKTYVFVNPEIVTKGEDELRGSEGCLSFPKLSIKVKRSTALTLRWQDVTGAAHEADFADLEAICIQHEIDHLDGITFIERIPKIRKQSALQEYFKNN